MDGQREHCRWLPRCILLNGQKPPLNPAATVSGTAAQGGQAIKGQLPTSEQIKPIPQTSCFPSTPASLPSSSWCSFSPSLLRLHFPSPRGQMSDKLDKDPESTDMRTGKALKPSPAFLFMDEQTGTQRCSEISPRCPRR